MNPNPDRLLIGILLWLVVAPLSSATVTDNTTNNTTSTSSPLLVTAEVLQARISEAEADPDLPGETKTKLLALYRESLANLKEADANSARAAAFEETIRKAPEQTQWLRKRIAAAREGEPPPEPELSLDTPRERLEFGLKTAQADIAATEARRADLERQMAYQEQRPAAITQRFAVAQDQQVSILAALQVAPAAGEGVSLAEARRWGRETRYIALSAEIKALEQELLSLPMRLDLLKAKRDEERASADRIRRQEELLKGLVTDHRAGDLERTRIAAERTLQAARESDPALARLAASNARVTETLGTTLAESDRLEAKQREAERVAVQTKANFERIQRAQAVSGFTEGMGELLLAQRDALPDLGVYSRGASQRSQEIASVTLSHLRHLEEAERIADPAGAAEALLDGAQLAETAAARTLLQELLLQRRELLRQQLEANGERLERLRKLQTSEARMLEVARAYDAFLAEHLFWLRTGPATRLADLAALPQEVGRFLSPERRSALIRTFSDQVVPAPAFWLALLIAAFVWLKRRVLIAALERAGAPLADPGRDHFFHTIRALLLTLVLASPLPLLLGVTGWRLLAAPHSTELSLTLGAYLVRLALILFTLLSLRAACLPKGLAILHFHWNEARVLRFRTELRWLIWVAVPAVLTLRIAMVLDPLTVGGPVARLSLLVVMLALGSFFYTHLI